MKYFTAAALLCASIVSAAPAPVAKRATNIDSSILNYALTLEHLENAFYTEGLEKFSKSDFFKAGYRGNNFYKNLEEISVDESSHVAVLTSVLKAGGYKATAACEYDFGITDPQSFVALAMVLEGVGVSAYLGAAANITDKGYLTAAGSILTTEARHNAWIRQARKGSPFASPYDIPLDFDQVYSLAAPFITSCPSDNPELPVKAFPKLTFTGKGVQPKGSSISFELPEDFDFPDSDLYLAWPVVTGPVFKLATVDTDAKTVTCEIPTDVIGPTGQSYAILTSSSTSLTDDNTLAGPAIVPVLAPYLA